MANPRPSLTLRSAMPHDVPVITAICLTTMPTTDLWSYRYNLASQYPHDYHFFTSKRFALRTDPATREGFLVLVIETLEDDVPVVIGYVVWQGPDENWAKDLPGLGQRSDYPPASLIQDGLQERYGLKLQSSSLNDTTRRDADPARLQLWREATARVKKEIFDTEYGVRQLDLIQRAVLPKYQKQGVGTFMLYWGMRIATEHSWALTSIVPPKACKWYEARGFKLLATERLQVEGQEQSVEFLVMGAKPV
ncbi:uncharacterized protein LY89DRAFT_251185 [Mollisia scopiformis]|uniref:N-acetyltransferase domain-containing protein n=1 Tax=Mollisia scopiformis TaxID=149040 RepID=A0A194WS76_MOLSC|nr:uncharacterized protein LY89DRAFT_251185 [Mollisia scopiformis]KUJ10818.1 hypothetical protein LY89DRAFT_251185 [Mollisia scopiformis]